MHNGIQKISLIVIALGSLFFLQCKTESAKQGEWLFVTCTIDSVYFLVPGTTIRGQAIPNYRYRFETVVHGGVLDSSVNIDRIRCCLVSSTGAKTALHLDWLHEYSDELKAKNPLAGNGFKIILTHRLSGESEDSVFSAAIMAPTSKIMCKITDSLGRSLQELELHKSRDFVYNRFLRDPSVWGPQCF